MTFTKEDFSLVECFFCGDEGMFGESKVRAKDETPEEAKWRPVCEECDPRL